LRSPSTGRSDPQPLGRRGTLSVGGLLQPPWPLVRPWHGALDASRLQPHQIDRLVSGRKAEVLGIAPQFEGQPWKEHFLDELDLSRFHLIDKAGRKIAKARVESQDAPSELRQ